MVEYKTGIELTVGGDAAAKLAQVFKIVSDLEKATTSATDKIEALGKALKGLTGADKVATQVEEMGNALKGLSGSSRSLNSITQSMDKLSGATGGATRMVSQMDAMAQASETMAKSQRDLSTALAENARLSADMARNLKTGAEARSRTGGGHGDAMLAATGAAALGYGTLDILKDSVGASMAAAKQQAVLGLDKRLTPDDISTARSQSEALARQFPGSTIGENLEDIAVLKESLGDYKEAMAAQSAFVRLRLGEGLLDQHRAEAGDTSAAGVAAMVKSMEMLGRFKDATGNISPERLTAAVNSVLVAEAATNRQVQPSMFLGYAKQAGAAGLLANDNYLFTELPTILQMMGGNRAGTGQAAIYDQFVNGKMSEANFAQLKKYGLLDKSAVRGKGQGGRVADATSHLVGKDEIERDPVAWLRDYFDPIMDKLHISDDKRLQVLSQISQRATGGRFLIEIEAGLSRIEKDRENILNTKPDVVEQLQATDPTAKLKAFEGALNEFMVTLGDLLSGPAVQALEGMTKGLHDLSDWAKANPVLAKDISETVVALGLLSGAIGILYLAVLPFVGMAKTLGEIGTFIGRIGTALGASPALASRLAGPVGFLAGTVIPTNNTPTTSQELAERDRLIKENAAKAGVNSLGQPIGREPNDRPGWDIINRPRPPMNIQLHGDVNLDGRKVGSLVAGAIADQSQRANQSIGGLNLRLNPFPAEQGGAW